MRKTVQKTLALVLTLALCVFAAGCGGSSSNNNAQPAATANNTASEPAAAEHDGVFNWGLMTDIVSLDPIYAYDTMTNAVVNNITEGLLYMDEDNALQCQLLSDWEVVDDLTYVYHVRDDVNFSDGNPMTMEDVLFSLNRHIDSDSFVGWMYDNVESIEQTGDWEFTVHLSVPDALWQYTFGTTAGHIIEKAYYEEHADDFGTATGGIIGTGPYVLDHWANGSEIVLTANENYWDGGFHFDFNKLVFSVIVELHSGRSGRYAGSDRR